MTDVMKKTELNEAELDQVQGGIALLLPAVQSVRETASSENNTEAFASDNTAAKGSKGGQVTALDALRVINRL